MWGALGVAPVVVCRAEAIQKDLQAQGKDADAVGVDVWEQNVAMLESRVYVALTERCYYCVERLSGAAAKGGIFHIVTRHLSTRANLVRGKQRDRPPLVPSHCANAQSRPRAR